MRAIVLGIVEGLTEFLPVSSTGHLILVSEWLGIEHDPTTGHFVAPWGALLWISQFAAILAVIGVFFPDLWRRTFSAPPGGDWKRHLVTKLLVAFLPTAVLGIVFKKMLDQLETAVPVAIALIVGAVAMEFIDRRFRRTDEMQLDDITLRQAFLIGVIQSLSMVPGVSRAGATIMGGMVLGLTPRVATQFSFYLAIPTMLAAAVYTLKKYMGDLSGHNAAILFVGCATSFTVALLVVAGFLEFVRRYRFTTFAVYRVVLGLVVLIAAAL